MLSSQSHLECIEIMGCRETSRVSKHLKDEAYPRSQQSVIWKLLSEGFSLFVVFYKQAYKVALGAVSPLTTGVFLVKSLPISHKVSKRNEKLSEWYLCIKTTVWASGGSLNPDPAQTALLQGYCNRVRSAFGLCLRVVILPLGKRNNS